jgi:MinD-like ATPase involved in chromosome partitioning or flagellar assembly
VITSPKGGTGKSTLSLNLAAYMALRVKSLGKRVCIIDANFQQADVGKMLGAWTPTVSNLLRDPSSLSPNGIMRYLVTRDDLNLSALLGPAIPEEANPAYLTPRLYLQILDALRPNFDYIFIDTPVAERYHDLFQDFLLPAADFIILPVTPVMHTILDANSWLELVTQPEHMNGNGVDPNRVGFVINQVEEGIEFDESKVRRELSHWRYLGSVPRSKAWINAVNNAELVATRNYVELNKAFSQILWYATGEDVLRYDPSMTAGTAAKPGLFGKWRRRS